ADEGALGERAGLSRAVAEARAVDGYVLAGDGDASLHLQRSAARDGCGIAPSAGRQTEREAVLNIQNPGADDELARERGGRVEDEGAAAGFREIANARDAAHRQAIDGSGSNCESRAGGDADGAG